MERGQQIIPVPAMVHFAECSPPLGIFIEPSDRGGQEDNKVDQVDWISEVERPLELCKDGALILRTFNGAALALLSN